MVLTDFSQHLTCHDLIDLQALETDECEDFEFSRKFTAEGSGDMGKSNLNFFNNQMAPTMSQNYVT